MTKVRRKRVAKPPVMVVKDDLITVPIPADVIAHCDGCFYYDEEAQKCNDPSNRDCTGVIFVEKNKKSA